MEGYSTDDEQVEKIKQWWSENGRAIIAGVVLGVGGLLGWRGWESYQEHQSEAASVVYTQMLEALARQSTQQARSAAEALVGDHPGSAYAQLARLTLARIHSDEDNLAGAEAELRGVIDRAGDRPIGYVGRLRLARLLIDDDRLDAALDVLQADPPPAYVGVFSELEGDIHRLRGEPDQARAAYLRAQAAGARGEALRLKLQDVTPIDAG